MRVRQRLLTEEFPEKTNAAHSTAEPFAETWATGFFSGGVLCCFFFFNLHLSASSSVATPRVM